MSLPSETLAWYAPTRDARALAGRVVAAMKHPWIAAYGLSFGPPLAGLSPRLTAALAGKRAAFEKLETYFSLVFSDVDLAIELGRRNAELVRRLHGADADPSDHSWRALDLELRLRAKDTAPPDMDALELPRERLEGRFLVRLDDPFGAALSHRLELPARGQCLELRVWPEAVDAWCRLLERVGEGRVIRA